MNTISADIRDGLNLALNEAGLIGLDFDEKGKTVYVTVSPIAIQTDGTVPPDNRFLFAFRNVGRLATSLTLDKGEKAIQFSPDELADKMNEYKNEQIYGWEFIDNGDKLFKDWESNMSFDHIVSTKFNEQHTIDLFQADKYSKKSIDLRIWFDYLEIFDSQLSSITIQTFIDNGQRGWEKLRKDGWTTLESDLGSKLKMVDA